jgi:hypothetical protein
MQYFLYASTAKVDMLLPQIPHQEKVKLAGEIGVNVGVFSAKLKSEVALGLKEDRISRLHAVTKFLEKTQDIGTVDEPKAWVEGSGDIRIVYPDESRRAVFFVGRSAIGTRYALAGSSAHLLTRGGGSAADLGWSFLPDLMAALNSMIRVFENPHTRDEAGERTFKLLAHAYESEWIDLVAELERQAPPPAMKVHFLAKRLLNDTPIHQGFGAVLATPLYIAMEE